MKGKRFKENQKRQQKKKTIVTILLLIFISIMIFSGIKIIIWFKENGENKTIIENIRHDIYIDESKNGIDKYSVDFNSLKQKNSDTVGWIKVNGTDINFPVLKTNNNDYYMTHNFDKTENSAGWVFVDYKNKLDGKDQNTVIYAHNRRDSSMFGTLKNILDKRWQENSDNLIIPFITENEKAEYQVFSLYRIEKEDYYITTSFGTTKEFQKFIDKIKERSQKDFDIQVTTDDNILTLSTCDDDNNYRVVLHAKKIK